MHAETLIKLIEELIEVKIRQYAGTTAGTAHNLTPELARVIAMSKVADRDKIAQIRKDLLQLLSGGEAQS